MAEQDKNKKDWVLKISETLGREKVETSEEVLKEYAEDYTEAEPHLPDVVVKAEEVKDVVRVVKFAKRHKIPITPVVANSNVGGIAIPVKGGIVLDLKGMKNIVEFNRVESYIVIEPGVTFGDLKDFFDKNAPDLTIAYPLAPPEVSVVANCLLDGLGNLGYVHGSMGEWIGGLEAVLPDGKLLKTGSCALSSYWFSRAPLPDLTGLFVNWQGTTGIVTKLSVQLWKNPPFRKRTFSFTYSVEDGFEILRSLSNKFIFSDLAGITWPAGKMLFGVENPIWRDPSEPEFFIYADITAYSKEELKAKVKIFEKEIQRFRKLGLEIEGPLEVDNIIDIAKDFKKFADFPMTLDFLLEKGGLSWIGTYGPTSKWGEGVRKGEKIMLEKGFPPIVVTRPMKGGHYGVLRFITTFDKKDKEVKKRVREANEKLAEIAVGLGYVPYKMPSWLWKKLKDKFDPTYLEILEKIKTSIDRNGIMNPGRLIF